MNTPYTRPRAMAPAPGPWRGAVAAALIMLLTAPRLAAAQTTYGTLDNFDVFNDTGEPCHGFEIELDGLSSADVLYTFGTPYERYGDPVVVDFPGGVYVRYESSFDSLSNAFTQTTPLAPAVITPTDGHACWTGGSADYLTSGCEHFGISLRGNPTATVYRWLVADPLLAGVLRPTGTQVRLPAPIWNVTPPPPAGGGPIVQAVVAAPPAEGNQQFGPALWVKVFVTESPAPADLDHLLSDDPAVPQDAAETEVEWVILQSDPSGQGNSELANEAQAAAGAESVTRRYEFYEYTGTYDPESHEVMCGGDGGCDMPLEGELGNYLGAQMAAVNLAALDSPLPTETPTDLPTDTPTETVAPTDTETPVPTDTETPVPTATAPPPTDTPPPTATNTALPTATAIPTDTPRPVSTNTPLATRTAKATATNTVAPTATPTRVRQPTKRPPPPTRTRAAGDDDHADD